eukprot:TRINITY_DN41639_c0_g1_i1.p1 TRINITY_DN41639_c0_g1~~TRINITY_DN41639_c0_g1_i1.p1  ORF type:complete len:417 (+),score=64.68 TRINITY_DN41639_c0_g1_i1:46-1296(+)
MAKAGVGAYITSSSPASTKSGITTATASVGLRSPRGTSFIKQRLRQEPLWSPRNRPAPLRNERESGVSMMAEPDAPPDWPAWMLASDLTQFQSPRIGAAERMRSLVQSAMERVGVRGRLAEILADSPGKPYDIASRRRAREFAESCVISVGLWRRFGSAEFAEAIGFVERTDYAAMIALLPGRAVDAAVAVWRSGRHAVASDTAEQRTVQKHEVRAWELGNQGPDAAEELRQAEYSVSVPSSSQARAEEHLARCRACRASKPGEAVVKAAYERLLVGHDHSLWDFWRKREAIVQAALDRGGMTPLREALRQVRGFCGPDKDNERAAWAVVMDLKTVTPLADDAGPVTTYGDYTAWLRDRYTKRQLRPAFQASCKAPPWPGSPGLPSPRSPRARPPTGNPGSIMPDLTGLPTSLFKT